MFRTFQRIRHIKRYREILQILAKYGFGEAVDRLGLPDRVHIPFRKPRSIDELTIAQLDSPQRLRLAIEELGPAFIKLGQNLSARPEIVPPEFLVEIEKLQDQVPPQSWEIVKPLIEDELGGSIDEFFLKVDPEPLAAASFAQVHGAILKDGTDVVLKIQRPRIRRQIQIDLEILEDVASVLQVITPWGKVYDMPNIIEEFAYAMKLELDYRYEGQNADTFRQNFRRDAKVHIPEIYWEYATERLLVMERLYGIKIDNVAALKEAGYDCKAVAHHAAQIIIKEVLVDGFFHGDPHPGNLMVLEGGVIGVLDFGLMGWLDPSIRRQIAQLFIVFLRRDIDGMVEVFIQLGAADLDVNKRKLRHDLSRSMRKYYGIQLDQFNAADFLQELTHIIVRNKLRFPTDLWLLLKTLTIMEGIGRQLDPAFDIFKISQPYIRRLVRQLYSFSYLRDQAFGTASSLTTLLVDAPTITLDLLRRLESGRVKFQIEPVSYERLLHSIDTAVNRLAASLLISAMILGLAMLIPFIDEANTWFYLFLVAMFASATILGLWMAYSILRGTK